MPVKLEACASRVFFFFNATIPKREFARKRERKVRVFERTIKSFFFNKYRIIGIFKLFTNIRI